MSVTLQAPPSSAEFITGLQARRRLNCGYSGLVRAALLGQIRVEILPGLSPRYSSADVDRLAERRKQAS